MLDLTSAFDTVDHQILLDVLYQRFAVNDLALDWFRSYLSNRSYTVHLNRLNSVVSETVVVDCGVAQGSSLGPKTFIAYTEEMDGSSPSTTSVITVSPMTHRRTHTLLDHRRLK